MARGRRRSVHRPLADHASTTGPRVVLGLRSADPDVATGAAILRRGDETLTLEPGDKIALALLERVCLGWSDRDGKQHPCPSGSPAWRESQCYPCAQRHHAPPATARPGEPQQRPSMEPHVVYIASYGWRDGEGDALLKVGTAAAARVDRRLLEQGALAGVIAAHCADEHAALEIERRVTQLAGVDVPDRVHPTRRLRAIAAACASPPSQEALLYTLRRKREEIRHRLNLPLEASAGEREQSEIVPARWLPAALPTRTTRLKTGAIIQGAFVGLVGPYLCWHTPGGNLRAATVRSFAGWTVRELEEAEREQEQLSLFGDGAGARLEAVGC